MSLKKVHLMKLILAAFFAIAAFVGTASAAPVATATKTIEAQVASDALTKKVQHWRYGSGGYHWRYGSRGGHWRYGSRGYHWRYGSAGGHWRYGSRGGHWRYGSRGYYRY